MNIKKIVTQPGQRGAVTQFDILVFNGQGYELYGSGETNPATRYSITLVSVTAQFFRLVPTSYKTCVEMRADLIINTSSAPVRRPGVKISPGHQLVTSSKLGARRTCSSAAPQFGPEQSHAGAPNGWAARPGEWLEIDLGREAQLRGLIVAGGARSVRVEVQCEGTFQRAGTFAVDEAKQTHVLDVIGSRVRLIVETFEKVPTLKVDVLVEVERAQQAPQKLRLSRDVGSTRSVSDCFAYNELQYGACQSYIDGPKCWCPADQQKIYGQYLEIILPHRMFVGAIATQGRTGCCWVTKYKVEYLDSGEWKPAGEFEGNVNNTNVKRNSTQFFAEAVRIYPLAYHDYIDMRADVYVADDEVEAIEQDE